VLVGTALWIGEADRPLTRIADLTHVGARYAAPSPRSRYVAVVGADGVWIVGLRDGSLRALSGSSGGCTNGIAWSKDETLLAWIDCSDLSVHITDVATDRVVRTIAGPATGLTAMPTGDLVVTRDSDEHGEGARSIGVVYTFGGTEKARFMGYAWSLSADGRYLLNVGSCCAGGPSSSLTDLRAPAAPPVMLPGVAAWTADGRILVTAFTRS
jgi:WD40 repeat protein